MVTYLADRPDSRSTTRPDPRTCRPGDPDVRVRTRTGPVVARGHGRQAMPDQPLLQHQSRRRGHSQSLRRNARNINEHAVTMTTSTAG